MSKQEIEKILLDHQKWLTTEGKEGMKADFCGANLRGADLRGADLCHAELCHADLRGANMDYSCLPLWCGGKFKADARICKQLIAHTLVILELSGEGDIELLKNMREYKAGWHRENELIGK